MGAVHFWQLSMIFKPVGPWTIPHRRRFSLRACRRQVDARLLSVAIMTALGVCFSLPFWLGPAQAQTQHMSAQGSNQQPRAWSGLTQPGSSDTALTDLRLQAQACPYSGCTRHRRSKPRRTRQCETVSGSGSDIDPGRARPSCLNRRFKQSADDRRMRPKGRRRPQSQRFPKSASPAIIKIPTDQ